MVQDTWDEYSEALSETILEALETNDYEMLRGIQRFSSCTVWTHLQGMESIINTLFEKTIDLKKESKDLKDRLIDDEVHYRELGVYKTMKERQERLEKGKIPIQDLKTVFNDMSRNTFIGNLRMLKDKGFIELDSKKGWNNSSVWLPKRYWEDILEEAVDRGMEESVYSSALGKMIAFCSMDSPTKTMKAIVIALAKEGTNITKENLKEIYLQEGLGERKMINFIKRDQSKEEDIRAVETLGERELQFHIELKRANERCLDRARQRARSVRRSS
ncbi:MAG: hypothetical protein ACOC5T_08660 [Elusimicrobiota bacterium]